MKKKMSLSTSLDPIFGLQQFVLLLMKERSLLYQERQRSRWQDDTVARSQLKLHFASFTYQEKEYPSVTIHMDRDRQISTKELMDEYLKINDMIDIKPPESLIFSLQLDLRTGQKDVEKQIYPDNKKLRFYLHHENMLHKQQIHFKVSIQSIDGEHQSDNVYGQSYFKNWSERPKIFTLLFEETNQVEHIEGKEVSRVLHILKKSKFMKQADFSKYSYSIKKLDNQVEINQYGYVNLYSELKETIISDLSIVIIRLKDKEKKQPKKANLHIKGAEANFTLNYEQNRQFRCDSICRMAQLPFPETFALKYKQKIIMKQQILGQLNLQSELKEDLLLEIELFNEAAIFNWLLSTRTNETTVIDQQFLLELEPSLSSFIKDSFLSTTILISSNIDKTNDTNIPQRMKQTKNHLSIIAYTTDQIYKKLNYNSRNRALTDVEGDKWRDNHIRFNLTLAKNIQYLPYHIGSNQPIYRGVAATHLIEQTMIYQFRQCLSTTISLTKAKQFIKANQKADQPKRNTLFQISHYSGRKISMFSAIDIMTNQQDSEGEILFSPYSQFLVRGIRKETPMQTIVILEEIPMVRNFNYKHVIFIHDKINEGIEAVNKIKLRGHEDSIYECIDILPFKSNEILQLWHKNQGYLRVPKDNTIVIFSLPAEQPQREYRINFINLHFPASKYIFIQNEENQEAPDIASHKVKDLRDLDKLILSQEGFNLVHFEIERISGDYCCCQIY